MADYTNLAARNNELVQQRHARTRRQQVRSSFLHGLAKLPVPPGHSDGHTILLIRPDHLGDVLLTTPAISALRQARPDARLVALVGPWSAGIISAYPEVDLTLTLSFPGFARHPARPSPRPYLLAWQWARQIRRLQAEAAVIFRPDHWWGGMLAYLAGVPDRIGFDLPDVGLFLTHRMPLPAGHTVKRSLMLVSPWTGQPDSSANLYQPALHFPVDGQDRATIQRKLAEAGLPNGAPRVIIHPGSGTLIKQWPPAYWARVADHLAQQWGCPIILTGGDHEIALCRSVAAMMSAPAIIMAGETTIYQLAALYEGARVVLGPDSGPLHLAVATGTPTVHLFGPAAPDEFGPWGSSQRHAVLTTPIACRPCRVIDWPGSDPAEHPCVRDIAPDDVLAAALRVSTAQD